MKASPYFNLTQAEPHTAIWAGLLLILLALTAVSFAGQRLSAMRRAAAGGAGPGINARTAVTPRRTKAPRNAPPLPAR
ncbi:MAG: hypothetical protein QOH49_2328 [Acidobacteriota bacterium]|jgi:hypothetical protein|nr:hypothetical protein [Acidobacteriota bacterium]